MKIVLLGHMGRDEAVVDRLKEHKLYILGQWANPGLVEKSKATGGDFQVIDSVTDVEIIADYVQRIKPDMFLTNFDSSLEAGVVDAIKQRVSDKKMPDLLIPCPDRESSRVEWDKFYLRELIDKIDPKYNPKNFMVKTPEAATKAIDYFKAKGIEIALKPRNLTGGKGVKVQGKHFNTYEDGRKYALQVLAAADQTGIEVQEKLVGHEFTLQFFTDGKTIIRPPATYDYPYRKDGDEGPGTGGMGAFSMKDGLLPFVTKDDYSQAVTLMKKLLVELITRGHDYKGVLYPTFFKTVNGLKIVEVNARGGDPELINVVDLMEDDVDFGEVLQLIALGKLAEDSISYKKLASAIVYLVSPDYSYEKGPAYEFEMDTDVIKRLECNVRFAASERISGNRFRTVGSSRTVGISALADTPWLARTKILDAIKAGFKQPLKLEFRSQIAEEEYIKSLVP